MTQRIPIPRFELLLLPLLAALLALPGAARGAEAFETGYGFFRTVEGDVQLTTFDKAEPIPVEPNYPVLSGDRLWVRPGARVEMVLPDGSVLRSENDSDLYLESLALSPDTEDDESNVLHLLAGALQIRLADQYEVFQPTRIDVEQGNIYLQAAGLYALEVDDRGVGRLEVREGFAEIVTDLGSVVVRAGEGSYLDGGYATVADGGGPLAIEHWGQELEQYAVAEETRTYVDPEIAYAAAPLERHGSWVSVSGTWGWQPHVVGSWRPFTSGWWVHTPAGLTWVSNEPWGWVTSHYGVWDYVPGYGWTWFPGSIYSPAWVYWYWGPTHVAWIPAGYYSRFYGPRYGGFGFGLNFGVYGWAGGAWNDFGYWTFCPVRYFGRRGYGAYWRSGEEVRRFGRYRAVPRGVITNDTRALHPGHWGKPQEVAEALERTAALRGRQGTLADVTEFVRRSPNLNDDVRSAVVRGTGASVSGGSGSTRTTVQRVGKGAPWAPEQRALPSDFDRGATTSRPSAFVSTYRDPAVVRGTNIHELRRSQSAGTSGGSVSAAPRTRGAGPTIGGFSGRGGDGGVKAAPPASAMPRPQAGSLPPSARGLGGTGIGVQRFNPGTDAGADRTPVIQQLIERMRSQGASPASPPGGAPSGSGRSGVSSGSSSPSGGGESSASSRPSSGSGRSGASVRSSGSSSRSGGSPSARGGSSSSSRSSGRSKGKVRKPPTP